MAVKFLSFLGIGNYKTVKYEYRNDDLIYIDETEVKYVQIPIYGLIKKILANSDNSTDLQTYIFMTEQARKANYDVSDTEIKNSETLSFFKDRLNITDISILDGKNEIEIWENFSIILDTIEDNDRIFVDITHSFRSIPIMFMSLLNYAKSCKNIKVEGIFYGAFENRNEKTQIAPIFNLTSFLDIIDWTQGADLMLKKGGSFEIYNLSKNIIGELNKNIDTRNNLTRSLSKLTEKLNRFFEALNYSDVRNVCFEVTDVKKCLAEVYVLFNEGLAINTYKIKPFTSLLENVGQLTGEFLELNENEMKHFNELVIKKDTGLYKKVIINTNAMIGLCLKFDLYQQAITLFKENCISIITFEMNKNIFCEGDRNIGKDYIHYLNDKKAQKELKFSDVGYLDEFYSNNYKELHESISVNFLKTTDLRNRVSHASFNLKNNANIYKSKDIIENSYEIIKDVFEYENEDCNYDFNGASIFLNFTNHPSDSWSEAQLSEAVKYGEIIDLPFPDISHTISNNELIDMAEIYKEKIKLLKPDAILCQGEMVFTHLMVNELKSEGFKVLAAMSERVSQEMKHEDKIIKTSEFLFLGFREYI